MTPKVNSVSPEARNGCQNPAVSAIETVVAQVAPTGAKPVVHLHEGEHEGIRLVERGQNLVARNRHRLGLVGAALDRNEP
jgi:hypothetical protein